MIWVGWREQRTETLIAVGIVALVAVLLVPSGIDMASAYHRDGIGACLGQQSFACGDVLHSFQDRFTQISDLVAWLTLLPGLIGVLLAAPFVHQLESGSYRLDWTQSITRRRWIVTKLGLAAAAAVLVAAVYIGLVVWWRAPLVHVTGRMDSSVFDSEGIVVVGYALFALGLAVAVGAIWRRAVAALVVGFVAYFAARLSVDLSLRQRLTPPLGTTFPINGKDPAALRHAWVISQSPSDRLGHPLAVQMVPACRQAANPKACLFEHGPKYMHALYEPASRFWSMQLVEFGLFTGMAVALIVFAGCWTARRG